jgi:hypothetical protein
MNSKILLLLIILSAFAKPNECKAQVIASDSLALVDFYNNMGGTNWPDIHWDFNINVGFWQGVNIDEVSRRVTGVELQNQNVIGTIPTSFGNLTGLTSLNLSSNKLTTLSFILGNLVNLTILNFRDNRLVSPIPSTFENLINLTTLDLEQNLFTGEIPEYFANAVNLEKVFLGENKFTGSIPEYFGSMTKLTTLYLHQNLLSGHIPVALSNGGKPLTGGMYLEISNCKFTFADIEPFAQLIHDKFDNSPENYAFIYSSQALIPITFDTATLAISPGGTYGNNTISWYKNTHTLVATYTGDTTFAPTEPGIYQASINNSVAQDLTLWSDSLFVDFQLADTSITGMGNISGTNAVTINNGIVKIVTLKPTAGANPLSGNIMAILTVDENVNAYNNQPYVQRHYDIIPAVNAENAQATVTLFFTQQDFDNYNSYLVTNNLILPLLPTNGLDNGNVRITQFHGTFTGSSNPANYGTGASVNITPTVTWNVINNYWQVTYPVNGFSGFYLSTANIALPLTLLNFSGNVSNGVIRLNWKTIDEKNTRSFIIQRSNDNQFENIGTVPASALPGYDYFFEDQNPLSGNNFYRLKMIDKDGQFKFSDVVKIKFTISSATIKLYPNPVTTILNLKFNSLKAESITTQVTDALGKIVVKKTVTTVAGNSLQTLNVEQLNPGVYYLTTKINGHQQKVSFVKE